MDLHKNKGQVTVVIDLSFSASLEEVKEFILNEQSPFILSQSDENLLKFEWFIDEDTKTATLLEVFANAEGFEVLAGKVMGTPVNLKFRDLFTVEKMTQSKTNNTLVTKIRKITGWALIIISTILMFISIFIATTGELLKGGGIYVASQLTWYPGLALLGPEIVQKSKEIWNNFMQRLKNGFTQK